VALVRRDPVGVGGGDPHAHPHEAVGTDQDALGTLGGDGEVVVQDGARTDADDRLGVPAVDVPDAGRATRRPKEAELAALSHGPPHDLGEMNCPTSPALSGSWRMQRCEFGWT
jgi:hypothetical protein